MKRKNIAIIAHVDHGKTTLVDRMLVAGKLFSERETPGELILDSGDLERERGITILSKNVSVHWKDTKINVIDTPGHSDFGGEVERVLSMADGVLLLVDAFEGPMPQTRFVLQKALCLGLKPVLVVNKVDKKGCDPDAAVDAVFDLMVDLGADEDQLDFPVVFGSARDGWLGKDWREPCGNIEYLLDTILEKIPEPKHPKGNLQLCITSLGYSTYTGRIAIGRVSRGELSVNQDVLLLGTDGAQKKCRVRELETFEGLGRAPATHVEAGEICAITGLEGFEIGDTVADLISPEALPRIDVEEPTLSMLFAVNDSPFYGREGRYVSSRHLRERLERELESNLALQVEDGEGADSFRVCGRGVLHLAILIETMRREGYELQVGQPRVLTHEENGKTLEPMEELNIDLPEEHSGAAIERVQKRRATLVSMETRNGRTYLVFKIPSRGLIGLRGPLLTATSGEAVISHRFTGFEEWAGEIPGRQNGTMVSIETGKTFAFSIHALQERGTFFIGAGEDVYEGQIMGMNGKRDDLGVNVCKAKKLTNMRTSSADEKVRLTTPVRFSLEEALEYIEGDEYVEVTPKSLRLRKIFLKEHERKRIRNAKNK